MRMILSDHLRFRLAIRNIPENLPQHVYLHAAERYADERTRHTVAVMVVMLYGKRREVMVAYRQEGQAIRLVTIHPLKRGQKENRIRTMRWRRVA